MPLNSWYLTTIARDLGQTGAGDHMPDGCLNGNWTIAPAVHRSLHACGGHGP